MSVHPLIRMPHRTRNETPLKKTIRSIFHPDHQSSLRSERPVEVPTRGKRLTSSGGDRDKNGTDTRSPVRRPSVGPDGHAPTGGERRRSRHSGDGNVDASTVSPSGTAKGSHDARGQIHNPKGEASARVQRVSSPAEQGGRHRQGNGSSSESPPNVAHQQDRMGASTAAERLSKPKRPPSSGRASMTTTPSSNRRLSSRYVMAPPRKSVV